MSEYLSDEEQLARLRAWWQDNGTALVVGVVLAVAAVVGWRWYQNRETERTVSASDLYVQFQQASGAERDSLATRIVEQGEGTAYPAFVLFAQANAAVADGDAAAAEPLLRRAAELATGEQLIDAARLRLARVLFELERADEALTELSTIRGRGYRALAAELKGDIHLSRGERTLAHQSYLTAQGFLSAEDQRPVLEMKIADTADASDS